MARTPEVRHPADPHRRRLMKRLFSGLPEELEPMNDLARQGARFLMRTETRRYGKLVTVLHVDGWDADDVERLGQRLKQQIGTGGTVKPDRVELQGDHRRRVENLLTEQGLRLET